VKEIVSVLAALKARGMSIILVEQNVALAAEISDRGYVMAVGEVVHEIGVGEWREFLGDERLVQAYLGES
jgi:ABC-type branched-subunit amino acid transport system ATPase component